MINFYIKKERVYMNNKNRKLFLLFYLCLFPNLLTGYIDPGTGSLLVYALLGIASSLYFILKDILYRLYVFAIGKFRKTGDTKKINDIAPLVIYSEGKQYFQVFEPILKELINQKIPCTYVTPDKECPVHEIKSPFLNVIVPGNSLVTISFMNHIKCKIVLATTPHLDIYMWKKSKKVEKYVHVFHSPTSVDFYEKYALSFYDIIFSVGPYTQVAQSFLDAKRQLPEKSYYNVGCPYFDSMITQLNSLSVTPKNTKTILYAPTWGVGRSSFFTVGRDLIKKLAKSGYNVIFRPHPQFFVSHIQELKTFLDEIKDLSVSLDRAASPLVSMSKADLMISDYSGIVFDFTYLFQKPVLLTTSQTSSSGYEVEDLNEDNSYDKKAIHTLGKVLTIDEIENIEKTVSDSLISMEEYKSKILSFRKENIYNFGDSGKCAAIILRNLLSE